jgi:hypothetical protein
MEFREIIELAKKRGLQTGKVKKTDLIEAFKGDRIYRRSDITYEVSTGNNDSDT